MVSWPPPDLPGATRVEVMDDLLAGVDLLDGVHELFGADRFGHHIGSASM